MDKFVGKRLDGRYEIREIIGVGGMAVVYKAYDRIEDRIVAVKILKEEFISNEEFILRFKNESKAIAVLNHPNIVKVYDVSFGDLIQYIVMEYVDGVTLKEYISNQGSLRWKDAVYLTIQVLRALQHAHDKGIVHRDVKPQNIMLLSDGTIKVTDFGIARFARSEHKTMTDKAIGSVHYISPEQARGELTNEKADIYSVGVMLYEMLTGRLPFDADSAVSVAIMQLQENPVLPRDINENIPMGLEQITLHAMQKDVGKRYKSAAEMLRDLEEFRRSPDMVFDYSYFVDDQPTKFVDAVNAPVVTPNANLGDEEEYEDDYYDDAEEEKSPVIPILTGIAIAFVVAAIAIGIILWKFVLNADNGESIIVPIFVGKTYTELQENSQYSDYNFVVELKSSETHEAGKVISQDPKDGRKIRKTQKITIVVSKGPDLQEIPKVDNLDLTTAKQVLKSAGFTWEVKYQTHNEIVSGNVITTNPEYGGKVAYGSKIDIYVSLGPEIIYVNYKSFSGYDLETAKKKIEEFGLTVGDITYKDSSTPKNIVIGQTPDVSTNTTIAKGTAVNLVVSSGEISYQTKLVIKDLPKNFKDEYKMMKMSVFVGGIKVFETDSEFNANDLENPWSIDISSKNQTTKAVINLEFVGGESPVKLEGALEYTVDFVNNSIMPTKNKIDDTYLDDSLVDNEQENQNPEGNN